MDCGERREEFKRKRIILWRYYVVVGLFIQKGIFGKFDFTCLFAFSSPHLGYVWRVQSIELLPSRLFLHVVFDMYIVVSLGKRKYVVDDWLAYILTVPCPLKLTWVCRSVNLLAASRYQGNGIINQSIGYPS